MATREEADRVLQDATLAQLEANNNQKKAQESLAKLINELKQLDEAGNTITAMTQRLLSIMFSWAGYKAPYDKLKEDLVAANKDVLRTDDAAIVANKAYDEAKYAVDAFTSKKPQQPNSASSEVAASDKRELDQVASAISNAAVGLSSFAGNVYRATFGAAPASTAVVKPPAAVVVKQDKLPPKPESKSIAGTMSRGLEQARNNSDRLRQLTESSEQLNNGASDFSKATRELTQKYKQQSHWWWPSSPTSSKPDNTRDTTPERGPK